VGAKRFVSPLPFFPSSFPCGRPLLCLICRPLPLLWRDNLTNETSLSVDQWWRCSFPRYRSPPLLFLVSSDCILSSRLSFLFSWPQYFRPLPCCQTENKPLAMRFLPCVVFPSLLNRFLGCVSFPLFSLPCLLPNPIPQPSCRAGPSSQHHPWSVLLRSSRMRFFPTSKEHLSTLLYLPPFFCSLVCPLFCVFLNVYPTPVPTPYLFHRT